MKNELQILIVKLITTEINPFQADIYYHTYMLKVFTLVVTLLT